MNLKEKKKLATKMGYSLDEIIHPNHSGDHSDHFHTAIPHRHDNRIYWKDWNPENSDE